jgi:hypothetical protein
MSENNVSTDNHEENRPKFRPSPGEIAIMIVLCILIMVVIASIISSMKEHTRKYSDVAVQEYVVPSSEYDYFTTIKTWYEDGQEYTLMYANDTKVMYIRIKTSYSTTATPVMNPDGTCQTYDAASE